MCGIFGSITNNQLSKSQVNDVHQIQSHRGPDGRGHFFYTIEPNKNLALLHQRLSIIDIDTGIQPMTDVSNNYTIVFNGEIFNYKELRSLLENKNYRFKTDHSDTEVLLNMYHEYGKDMLQYLNGMFAFAIFDRKKSNLFFARDRVGIKPLYYHLNKGELYFSSELKTLLLFNNEKTINPQSLIYYLSFQFVPAPESIFNNINKLEAGYYAEYDILKNHFIKNRYWDITFSNQNYSLHEWTDLIYSQLEKSVKLWSISDVEVGASLSGGLDSSATVALLSKKSAAQIKTFTIGFQDAGTLDERDLALSVSKKYQTEHFEYILKPGELLQDLDNMIYHLDEPYGGGLPSWYVYKLMKGKVKVAITGTGGDECFGNYGKSRIYTKFFRKKVIKLLKKNKNSNLLSTIIHLLKYPGGSHYHRYFTGAQISNQILNKNTINSYDLPEKLIEDLFSESHQNDPRNIVPYIDTKLQLPEEFLHMTDRFSMAFSIEARTAFLDHHMLQLAMSIPPEIRIKHDDPKYLLRKSVQHLLPQNLVNAPKKGFDLPISKWLQKDLKEEVIDLLNPGFLKNQGLFKSTIYTDFIHPVLFDHNLINLNYNSKLVWLLYMFQKWYSLFLTS